ncbi:TonB-dependent siderophore receptor [Pelistega europaea]|uniref:TonB-dependent siderophore receptor n=1 Tax=Pelistega europaea TaxID=106147 RepID=A0A7Y4P404_9BURK|nr:TonB-dependent siderophore receptor [Pelistega europaea]NOL49587.1 TonB-dependent siderophore receptor [Pelistega europaea]
MKPLHLNHFARTAILLSASTLPISQVIAQESSDSEVTQLEVIEATVSTKSPATTEGSSSYLAPVTYSTTGIPQELKDTTQSVSVITHQRIQDQPEFNRVIDVVANATGLNYGQYESDRFSITSRGQVVNSVSYDGVTTYYDTRFNYGDNHMDSAMFDRVEVVRGATGFMTGPGNPSASINLVRKAPTEKFQSSLKATAGSWNLYRLDADVSGSLNEAKTVRGRLVGSYQTRESFLDRYKNKRYMLYGVLEADLGPNTLLSVGGDIQHNKSDAVLSGGLPIFYSDGSLTDYDRSTNTASSWAGDTYTTTNLYATLFHRFSNGWKVETNYTHSKSERTLKNSYVYGAPNPLTNTGLSTATMSKIDGERVQDTFDIKLNGPWELFGRQHFARFNYNFNRNHYDNNYYKPVAGTLPSVWGDFRPSNFHVPEPQWEGRAFTALTGTITQHAISGINEFSLSDRLALTVGARLTRYKVSDTSFGPYFTPYKNSFNQVSKYLGLSYKLTDNFSVYTSYTDIFQPQTAVDANGSYLDPVIGKNYELGFKGTLADGGLSFAVAAFETRRDNLAVPTGARLPSGQAVNRSVDGAKTRGFDIDVVGAITDNWNVQMGFTSFVATDQDGKRISLEMPNRIFKLFTTYKFSGSLDGLTIGGGVNWFSHTERQVTNPSRQNVTIDYKPYAVVNLMARYKFNKHSTLMLSVNNLFDKKYYTNNGQFSQYQYGAPRNIQASFQYEF